MSDFIVGELPDSASDGFSWLGLERLGRFPPVVRGFDTELVPTQIFQIPREFARGGVVNDPMGEDVPIVPAVFGPPEVFPGPRAMPRSQPLPPISETPQGRSSKFPS